MKVLQIIDSLNAGGAERMAVTYANLLHEKGVESFLCCTREEGLLNNELNKGVGYIFLDKKSTLHLNPVLQLRKFIRKNGIEIVHAHGTSFFTATLQKLLNPKLKLVWHDHYGKRFLEGKKSNKGLIYCSKLFDAVITVNPQLEEWAKTHLSVANVRFLPNFVKWKNYSAETKKEGDEIQLVCLANLKEPKNHMNLLMAFSKILVEFPKTKLHLVGKDLDDEYSKQLKEFSKLEIMNGKVVFHGVRSDVGEFLQTMHIGILSSDSEGLPMSLLEYGQAGLAVVVTDVGECKKVVLDFGKIVDPNKSDVLASAILYYLKNYETMKSDSIRFQKHIKENYSAEEVLPQLLELYKMIL